MATQINQGEPYDLRGKRLAFLDYRYIRTAGFGWYDDAGNNVSVIGDQGPWDAHFISNERAFGIQIKAQPAERSESPHYVEKIKPWESDGLHLENLLFDEEDGYYKSWARCKSKGQVFTCFMQSKDFEHWERPELGLFEFDGGKNNNIVGIGGEFGQVFKDPSSQEERWKWIKEGTITREEFEAYKSRRPNEWDPKADRVDVPYETHIGPANLIIAVKGAVSPDGFRWTSLPEPLVVEHSDTIVNAYYDTKLKKYVGYFRDWMTEDRSTIVAVDRGLSWMVGRRSIGRAETDDFRNFPLSQIIMEPGPELVGPSDTLYTNGHTFVPHAPEQHVFFPTIWHGDNDATSVSVVSSRDGIIMHWLPGNPILTTASFMQFDGGCIFANSNLLELPDGRWVLPYIGYNFPHKYPRKGPWEMDTGFAEWKKGRMVAVEVKEYGQFTTLAIVPPGNRLKINALTMRGGHIMVEITDLERKVIPGRSFADCNPVVGDQYGSVVTWNGADDMGVAPGTPICLRFKMDQAKLFFVDFE